MHPIKISARLILIGCLAALGSFAQNPVKDDSLQHEIFAGSTPCDSLIRSQLGIITNSNCECIKWQLTLHARKNGSFDLSVYYGETKPNTNGFKNGGFKMEVKGKYSISPGSVENPKATILRLHEETLKSPLCLIVMDENILHFTDERQHFLVGNGGWGYVLNRITNKN